MRSRDAAIASALALVVLAVYARTLAPSVLPGDSGEFQFAANLLTVAHPTGYPLYLLLGKLFALLAPVGDAAYRLNLLSAVFSAAAVAVVYVAGRELGARSLPAAAAALVLGFSPTFWSQATRAEVYALNSLLTAGLIVGVLAATRGPVVRGLAASSFKYSLVAAVCLGLGLAHHRMIILLAPALAVYLWLNRSAFAGLGSWRAACLAGAALLPLLLYLYIPLRAPATPYFRLALAPGQEIVPYDGSLEALVRLLTGQGFQGRLGLAGWPDRLVMAWDLLVQQFTVVGLLLGLAGAIWLLARRPSHLVLLGVAFVAVEAFCLAYRIGDIADLFTPAYVLLAMVVAVGMELVVRGAEQAWAGRRSWAAVAAGALLCTLPAVLLVTGYGPADRSGDGTRPAWEALLSQPIPANAILVSNDRDEIMPLWYLQYVEGRRPDLLGLFPLITTEPGYANVMRLLDTVQPAGRPLYLIKDIPGLDLRYDYQADGGLYRVLGPLCLRRPEREIHADLNGQVRLLGADVGAAASSCGKIAGVPFAGLGATSGVVTVTLHWEGTGRAEADYQSFVHVLDSQGNKVAQSDHRPGDDHYPTSLWQAGEVLRDTHRLTVPGTGRYAIVCGMYRGDTLVRLGDAVSLGELAP